MHPASAFHQADEARLLAWIEAYPFMTLAASSEGRTLVAQAPVIVRRLPGGVALDFHLSRGNAMAGALSAGFQGVLLSLGPGA